MMQTIESTRVDSRIDWRVIPPQREHFRGVTQAEFDEVIGPWIRNGGLRNIRLMHEGNMPRVNGFVRVIIDGSIYMMNRHDEWFVHIPPPLAVAMRHAGWATREYVK